MRPAPDQARIVEDGGREIEAVCVDTVTIGEWLQVERISDRDWDVHIGGMQVRVRVGRGGRVLGIMELARGGAKR